MSKHFADRLINAIKTKGNPICVGLDPRLDRIPKFILEKAKRDSKDGSPFAIAADALLAFNKGIIDAVADITPVVKLQIACYEIFGGEGMRAYAETIKYAKSKGLITIADAKRNDIGDTALHYANAFLGEVTVFEGDEDEVVLPVFEADSITVNPYLGWDGVKPFIDEAEKYDSGIFTLVKTSNKSSGDLQDLQMKDGKALYEIVGHFVDSWGADHVGESGYSLVGAVVGATYPDQAKILRRIMPEAIFLVPGYGAQGGSADDIKYSFNSDGLGAVVNNSRGVIFAYETLEGFTPQSYDEAAREAVLNMKKDLNRVIG